MSPKSYGTLESHKQPFKLPIPVGMGAHVCTLSTIEAETRGIVNLPRLYNELFVSKQTSKTHRALNNIIIVFETGKFHTKHK